MPAESDSDSGVDSVRGDKHDSIAGCLRNWHLVNRNFKIPAFRFDGREILPNERL